MNFKKIRWRDDGKLIEGIIIGVVVKKNETILVVHCDDGLFREKPALEIKPT